MPKKAAKKKSGGAKVAKAKDGIFPEFVSLASLAKAPVAAIAEPADFVNVDIRMLNWRFMNFSVVLRATTTLKQIATTIEARHGKVADLRLFSSPPSLQSEITNLAMRLEDLGYKGSAPEHPENMILFYDYKASVGDSLLAFSSSSGT